MQIATLIACLLILVGCNQGDENKFEVDDSGTNGLYEENIEDTQKTYQTIENTHFFDDGDEYYHYRFVYSENSDENLEIQIEITGEEISVLYANDETREKIITSDFDNLPYTTLFVSTEKESILLGVPAVYSSDMSAQTLTILKEKELPLKITQEDGKFIIHYTFSQDVDTISEYWYFKTQRTIFYDSITEFILHDLSINARLGIDGYYFITPYNYIPSGEGVLYKHPSCLAGISLGKYGHSQFSSNLGYALVKTHLENQNEYGFFETGPKSEWLYTDYGFEEGFYDTRFNSDLVHALILIYKKTEDVEYYDAIIKYLEFYETLMEDYSYETENGGIFVVDYMHPDSEVKSHVSLNHFITEIHIFLEMYDLTKEEIYLEKAEKMFLAIEDTRDLWVLENNNLEYALYYEHKTNLMQDYLYLTYNDMFYIQETIEKIYGKRNETLDYLMDSKRDWLEKNGAFDYWK